MKLHFISGLPRSGSTLLSALLKQNPRFHAGMTSPISGLFRALEDATARRAENSIAISDKQRADILKGLFANYYEGVARKVVFDTSRMWCARMTALGRLFPKAKFIIMVRELQWIADSFEQLYRRNGQIPSGIYGWDTGGTVWTRTNGLMQSTGVVGFAYDAVREALTSEFQDRILLIDYEDLCRAPKPAMKHLYKFIGEPLFNHNYTNVKYEAGEFDDQLGAKGLHTVKGAVKWTPRTTVLPPPLFSKYVNDNFWRQAT